MSPDSLCFFSSPPTLLISVIFLSCVSSTTGELREHGLYADSQHFTRLTLIVVVVFVVVIITIVVITIIIVVVVLITYVY